MQLSAHNLVIFCLQTTSTVSEVLGIQSPFRSLPSSSIRRTLTQMRCRTVAVHRRWNRSLWAPTTLAVETPGSLHSFSLTGTIFLSISSLFARIQTSSSQYFTSINYEMLIGCSEERVFISTFYRRLASKKPPCYQTSAVLFHGRDVTRRG